MRTLVAIALLSLLAFSSGAQGYTKARADQISVNTNGMSVAVYPNLQTSLRALDTNLFLLRGLVLSPAAISNLISSATAASVNDLIDSVPALTDPSVTALLPTNSLLQAGSVNVSGAATIDTVRVTGPLVIGGLTNLVTERIVASAYVPTGTVGSVSNSWWSLLLSTNSTAYLASGASTNASGLNVISSGMYRVSFTVVQKGTFAPTAWVLFTTSSGTVSSNQCSRLYPSYGSPTNSGFSGSFVYPLSSGATIRAGCVYTNGASTATGGGVLYVSRAPMLDATGAEITGPLSGGW